MSSGKRERASMREGPLADLFRKTETEGLPPEAPAPGAPMGAHPRDADAAGTAAFMSKPREDDADEALAPPPARAPEPPRQERRIPSPQ